MTDVYKYKVSDQVTALYSPKTVGVVFCKTADLKNFDFERISSDDTRIRNELFERIMPEIVNPRPIRTLYLCTSYYCNLRCSYCLMQNSISKDKSHNYLSEETAEKVIDYFTRNSSENTEREVVFYGGEPALFPELMRFVVEKINEYDRKSERNLKACRYIMCTNGVLLNDELVRFIHDNNIYPAVSVDGTKEIHDNYRKTSSGEGSFDDTKRGYQKLVDAGVQAGISMTLGLHLSNELPALVRKIAQEFAPRTLALNTMVDFEQSHNPLVPGVNELGAILWEAFMVAREEGVYIVKNVMDNRVRPFVERRPRAWGCTGMGGRIGVLPDGKLVPCMALPNMAIDVSEDPSVVELFPERLMNASPLFRSECTECPAKATCGGGCPANSILNQKESPLDEPYCIASKLFLRNMINLLWRECENEASFEIERCGYFIPTDQDRKRIYGKIVVEDGQLDYQYTPQMK